MLKPNKNYLDLKDSYLFFNISRKVKAYLDENPGKRLYRLGIGDVSLPLCPTVIESLHEAVDDQSEKASFHGYMPECGADFLRKAIRDHYASRGVELLTEEVFVSSGASDELGDILDLFDRSSSALIMEPAYPAYVDANVMAGREIVHLASGRENGFLPEPYEGLKADLIYICSPNNPTGAVFSADQLKKWVDFANKNKSVILFDAAYEAFIEDKSLPRSIFEIDGAKTCAIEICSLSKTAGFTGTRLGYTVIPKALVVDGMSINAMWTRNRTTKTNGVSYIIQKGGAAVFTEEGQAQIRENIGVYKKNAKILSDTLDELNIRYTGGKNAPYIWMECPDNMSGWEFFDYLLNEIQVIGTPGEGFGECGKGCFRLSTFGSTEDTLAAAERMKKLLSGKKVNSVFDAEKTKNECVAWIRGFFEANGKDCNAVVGISGGKDSSVTAALCVEALGKDRVIGVLMPCGKQSDIDMAYLLVNHLGIKHYEINIRQTVDAVLESIGGVGEISRQTRLNLPARIRMATLYAVSQSMNGRVANTCNLSEDYVGYATRYGDGAGDFSPLSRLTVTEVKLLGRALKLPEELVEKTPIDGLCGKTDEENLGFTYAMLDRYIRTGEIEDDRIKAEIDSLHARNVFKIMPMPVFEPSCEE